MDATEVDLSGSDLDNVSSVDGPCACSVDATEVDLSGSDLDNVSSVDRRYVPGVDATKLHTLIRICIKINYI